MSPLIARGCFMVVLATASACERKPPADPSTLGRTTTVTSAQYEAPGATRTPMDATPINETFGGGTNAGRGPPAETPPPARLVTDPEILDVTTEAHERAIALAELAKRKAAAKDVKDYAAMMLAHHRDAENREKIAGQKAKITGAESALSAQLQNETTSTLATLRNQNGAGFDKAYIDEEVKAHERFLDTMDTVLLPSVQSTELKTWLPQLRAQVAMHLAKAKEIKQRLGS